MNINSIGARQIKAARALLDWSQDDLARATNLSIATIRKLELGYISPRSSTTGVLRQALEEAGIEFTDADGVRRRQEEIRIYHGAHGCMSFLEDVVSTSKRNGGELFAVASSDLALTYLFGARPDYALRSRLPNKTFLARKSS
jgi:transcriptional regulator with XRE-family HTH domain